MEIKLWDHQKLCIEKAREKDYHALFMDAGVGKSATCVNIIKKKYNKNKEHVRALCELCQISDGNCTGRKM